MMGITVSPDITIRQAMKKLSQSGEKCLVVTDDKNILMGTSDEDNIVIILRYHNTTIRPTKKIGRRFE